MRDVVKQLENAIKDSGKNSFGVYLFPQGWSTTALGFDEPIAGQGYTYDYTIVIVDELSDEFRVYFGGSYAYSINSGTLDVNGFSRLLDDIKFHSMPSVREVKSGHYSKLQ